MAVSCASDFVAEANKEATDKRRFKYSKVLGRGGLGTVMLAYDNQNNRDVAVKCVKASHSSIGAHLSLLISGNLARGCNFDEVET